MNLSKRKLAVVFTFLVGAIAIISYRKLVRFRGGSVSQSVSSQSEILKKPILKFQKDVLVSGASLYLDGKAVSVPEWDTNPSEIEDKLVGDLEIETGVQLPLFLGNVDSGLALFVRLPNKETFLFSQLGGDAGESWDSRSRLIRDSNGKATIEKIWFYSEEEYLENGNQAPAKCKTPTGTRYQWNVSKNEFEGNDFAPTDLSWITPPINIAGTCLDKEGRWKSP